LNTWVSFPSARSSEVGQISVGANMRVSAGVLTPVVWLFAVLFYRHRHRQRRWRELAQSGFNYGDA
jgi:hypothetical protein